METKKAILRLSESKSWFFEKINKIDRQVSQLIKRESEREDPKKQSEMKKPHQHGHQ